MTPAEIRFAADAMLLSLAKWLRLLGYDCCGGSGRAGRTLVEQAIAERRVLLTRNAHLHEYLPKKMIEAADLVFVAGQSLPEQVREVVTRFSLDSRCFVFTRCVVCNEPLMRLDASPSGVPPRVAAGRTEFWRCPRCGKLFWRGSHVVNSVERLQKWLALGGADR